MKVDWNKPLEIVLYGNAAGGVPLGTGTYVRNAPPPKVMKEISVYTAVFQSKYGRIYPLSFLTKEDFICEVEKRNREGGKLLLETLTVQVVEADALT